MCSCKTRTRGISEEELYQILFIETTYLATGEQQHWRCFPSICEKSQVGGFLPNLARHQSDHSQWSPSALMGFWQDIHRSPNTKQFRRRNHRCCVKAVPSYFRQDISCRQFTWLLKTFLFEFVEHDALWLITSTLLALLLTYLVI